MLRRCLSNPPPFHRSSLLLRAFLHYDTIQAVPRESTGKLAAAKERDQGSIPAVILSRDASGISPKLLVTTSAKQITSLMKKIGTKFFCSTVFGLQVRAGPGSNCLLESGKVLPIKVNRDTATGKVTNMFFVRVKEGRDLTVNVPIEFNGLDGCPGIMKGGEFQKTRTSLKLSCPSENVPQKLDVDLSNLDIGGEVLVKDIQIDPGLILLTKNDGIPICKITPKTQNDSIEV